VDYLAQPRVGVNESNVSPDGEMHPALRRREQQEIAWLDMPLADPPKPAEQGRHDFAPVIVAQAVIVSHLIDRNPVRQQA
jgi:hypothetical protein